MYETCFGWGKGSIQANSQGWYATNVSCAPPPLVMSVMLIVFYIMLAFHNVKYFGVLVSRICPLWLYVMHRIQINK